MTQNDINIALDWVNKQPVNVVNVTLKWALVNARSTLSQPDVAEMMADALRAIKSHIEMLHKEKANLNLFHIWTEKALTAYEASKQRQVSEE